MESGAETGGQPYYYSLADVNGDGLTDWVMSDSGDYVAVLLGKLRNWNQEYRAVATELTISLPAGEFHHCAKVEVSWVAHEHDMKGPQREVLYLAPHLGIVKREEWENGRKWHEEVLTKYERSGIQ